LRGARGACAGAFALAFVDFLDELGSGVAPVSAAEIRDEWSLAYGSTSVALLVVPLLIALLVEGPLLLASDRWPRRRSIPIGLALMGAALLLASAASSTWWLALAFGAWATFGGIACAQAQGALMDAFPDARERWMTRWTLCGAIGDAATPVLVTLAAWLGFGWRGALAAAGVLHVGHAIVLACLPIPSGEGDDDDDAGDESAWARVRRGLADRRLLAWLGACSLCCLLDEIFVVFGTLRLRDELGATPQVQALIFGLGALAAALGLLLGERLLARIEPLRLLRISCAACALAFVAWLWVDSLAASFALALVVELCAAPLYPICAAQAYACKPGESGLIAALDSALGWLQIVAPLGLGLIADRWGLDVALACLLVQPLGVALLAWRHADPRVGAKKNERITADAGRGEA
jgi:MFS family permease